LRAVKAYSKTFQTHWQISSQLLPVTETLASAAPYVAALQTECALKIDVSIPALLRPVLIHLAIVALVIL